MNAQGGRLSKAGDGGTEGLEALERLVCERIRDAVGAGTQESAALWLGVSQPTISRYRRLAALPEPIALLVRLVAHGIDGHWLLGGDAGAEGAPGPAPWRSDYLRGFQDAWSALSGAAEGMPAAAELRDWLLSQEAMVRERLETTPPGPGATRGARGGRPAGKARRGGEGGA